MNAAAEFPQLGHRQLLALFGELNEHLTGGVVHELLLVGGAALALRWDDRLSVDVDVVDLALAEELLAAVATVGAKHGLAPNWLNGSAAYFAPNMDAEARVVYRGERLVVRAAGPEYLLAMKLRAARAEDLHDAVRLATETGRTTRESLFELVADGYWRGTHVPNLEAFVTEILLWVAPNQPDVAPECDAGPEAPPEVGL